jgi:hypothetical protein
MLKRTKGKGKNKDEIKGTNKFSEQSMTNSSKLSSEY